MPKVVIKQSLFGNEWPHDAVTGQPLLKIIPPDGTGAYFLDSQGNALEPPPAFGGSPLAGSPLAPRLHVTGHGGELLHVSGLAAPFNRPSERRAEGHAWVFEHGCFSDHIGSGERIILRLGHDDDADGILADTDHGMTFSEDATGLWITAVVPADALAAEDVDALKRGFSLPLSIRFKALRYEWTVSRNVRTQSIQCGSLDHVAILARSEYPAFEGTGLFLNH